MGTSYLQLDIKIEAKGRIYTQPNCRIKTTPEGRIMCLVKNEEGKWEGVKGRLYIDDFKLRKEYYIHGNKKRIPNWLIKLFCKNIEK